MSNDTSTEGLRRRSALPEALIVFLLGALALGVGLASVGGYGELLPGLFEGPSARVFLYGNGRSGEAELGWMNQRIEDWTFDFLDLESGEVLWSARGRHATPHPTLADTFDFEGVELRMRGPTGARSDVRIVAPSGSGTLRSGREVTLELSGDAERPVSLEGAGVGLRCRRLSLQVPAVARAAAPEGVSEDLAAKARRHSFVVAGMSFAASGPASLELRAPGALGVAAPAEIAVTAEAGLDSRLVDGRRRLELRGPVRIRLPPELLARSDLDPRHVGSEGLELTCGRGVVSFAEVEEGAPVGPVRLELHDEVRARRFDQPEPFARCEMLMAEVASGHAAARLTRGLGGAAGAACVRLATFRDLELSRVVARGDVSLRAGGLMSMAPEVIVEVEAESLAWAGDDGLLVVTGSPARWRESVGAAGPDRQSLSAARMVFESSPDERVVRLFGGLEALLLSTEAGRAPRRIEVAGSEASLRLGPERSKGEGAIAGVGALRELILTGAPASVVERGAEVTRSARGSRLRYDAAELWLEADGEVELAQSRASTTGEARMELIGSRARLRLSRDPLAKGRAGVAFVASDLLEASVTSLGAQRVTLSRSLGNERQSLTGDRLTWRGASERATFEAASGQRISGRFAGGDLSCDAVTWDGQARLLSVIASEGASVAWVGSDQSAFEAGWCSLLAPSQPELEAASSSGPPEFFVEAGDGVSLSTPDIGALRARFEEGDRSTQSEARSLGLRADRLSMQLLQQPETGATAPALGALVLQGRPVRVEVGAGLSAPTVVLLCDTLRMDGPEQRRHLSLLTAPGSRPRIESGRGDRLEADDMELWFSSVKGEGQAELSLSGAVVARRVFVPRRTSEEPRPEHSVELRSPRAELELDLERLAKAPKGRSWDALESFLASDGVTVTSSRGAGFSGDQLRGQVSGAPGARVCRLDFDSGGQAWQQRRLRTPGEQPGRLAFEAKRLRLALDMSKLGNEMPARRRGALQWLRGDGDLVLEDPSTRIEAASLDYSAGSSRVRLRGAPVVVLDKSKQGRSTLPELIFRVEEGFDLKQMTDR